MEPTDPNVRMIEKKAEPQKCILTILHTFEKTVEAGKGLQHVMVGNTEEENIDLWVAFWWLRKNKDAMINIPIDMDKKERKDMCELTIKAFEEAEEKFVFLGRIVGLSSIFMDKDEMERTLQEHLDERLTLDKLNEILSIIHMDIQDASMRSN